MVKDSISLYTMDRTPMSLGFLTLKPGKYIEDIFDAVEDSQNFEELTAKFADIIVDDMVIDRQVSRYIRYIVTDVYNNRRYLKVKIKENK